MYMYVVHLKLGYVFTSIKYSANCTSEKYLYTVLSVNEPKLKKSLAATNNDVSTTQPLPHS